MKKKNEKKKEVKKDVLEVTASSPELLEREYGAPKKIGKLELNYNSDALNAMAAKINEIIDSQ